MTKTLKELQDAEQDGASIRSAIEEVDELLGELEEQMGEPYDIGANMKRLGQSDLRNFLTWMAYEVRAQEIMRELEDEE